MYNPQSPFVALTQLTATQLNQMLDNIGALHDGGGLATNAVTGDKLATSAITLGYAQIISAFVNSGSDNTLIDVTGLTKTVTVPAGGRDVEVVIKLGSMKTDAGAGTLLTLAVVEGSTVLDSLVWHQAVANYYVPIYWVARIAAPSAGSHTYKLQYSKSAGNVTINANPTGAANTPGPAHLRVKLA